MVGGVRGGGVEEGDCPLLFHILSFLFIPLLLFLYSFFYALTFIRYSNKVWGVNRALVDRARRVLLITAHPDDEVMFFGPTILSLLREGKHVYLLCLSYGDAEGLGWIRKEELWASCRVLGIPDENVTMVRHEQLKDKMGLKWPIIPVSLHVKNFVVSYGIDTVITFDNNGVSGHTNHISIHETVADMVERNFLPKNCDAYFLKSVGFIRQYILNVFNLPVSYCCNKVVLVAKGNDYQRIVRAMKAHKSQLLWFRRLHIFFSMYLFLNILQRAQRDWERKDPEEEDD